MKKLHIRLNGTNSLLMHSPKCVNKLHPIAIKIKTITDLPTKERNTEENLQKLSDLEWEAGVYWDEEKKFLYIPNECIAASFFAGAKMSRNGAPFQRYTMIVQDKIPLDIGEPHDYETLKTATRYRDVRNVVVNRSRVTRTRPRFDTWRCEFDMLYDEGKIDIATIGLAIENAGQYIGLCDHREAGYGRFAAAIEEVSFSN